MSLHEAIIEGTLNSDGTLELDEKPNLPAGRVTVVLRSESQAVPPQPLGSNFWQMMDGIWAGQKARGHSAQGSEQGEPERRQLQADAELEIEAAILLQEECRQLRHRTESESSAP